MRWLATCVAVGLWLGAGDVARAEEMYRWLDAQGRVHFGSEPPADARGVEPWSPDGGHLKIDARAGTTAGAVGKSGRAAAPRTAAGRPPLAEASERGAIGGRSRSEWLTRETSLEKRIEDLEAQLEELEETTQAYGGWGTHRDKRGRVSRVALPDRRRELETALERAESELDAFEEEARRAGVPPGWLR